MGKLEIRGIDKEEKAVARALKPTSNPSLPDFRQTNLFQYHHIMGGEKAPERVLIVLHRPIPEDVQAEIRHKFADAEVNFYNSVQGVPVPVGA